MIMNRTQNAIRSFFWGVGNKILEVFLPFISRTLLITYLGNEYVGLASLFTSILQMLNVTELGFNSAIVFCMYKPVAQNREDEICALLNVFRKVYHIIGLIIFIIGMCLIPILPKLIKGNVSPEINIYLIYILYLINTAMGYGTFAYRKSLLSAYNRQDVLSKINSALIILQKISEILIIIFTKNFYLVLFAMICTTLLENICVCITTKRLFPFVCCKGTLSIEVRQNLIQKIKGLMIQKITSLSRNSVGNVIVSMFIGLSMVTIYNNYYLIMCSVRAFSKCVINAMQSGVGNRIATNSPEENYEQMKFFDFMYMYVVGIMTTCMFGLYQPFMTFWLGDEYLLPDYLMVLICIYFYVLSMGDIRSLYTTGAGLWWEGRYKSVLEAGANIILSVVLGYFYGITGIILAMIISVVFINFGYETVIVFINYFKNDKTKEYFYTHIKHIAITTVIIIVMHTIFKITEFTGVTDFIFRLVACIVVSFVSYLIAYRNCPERHKATSFLKDIFCKMVCHRS